MTESVKISVIVPVYNIKKEYLKECLNSLTSLQDPEGTEIIAVNDGSTNGCEKVIEEFAREYPNVVYIDQENGGTSEARNAGLSRASGEYIMFVDADDYVSPGCLGIVYEAMLREKTDILFFGYSTNYVNREVSRVLKDPSVFPKDKESLELAVLKGDKRLGPVEVGTPWGKLIRHSVIRDNSLRYTKGLIKGQDTVFILSLFEHCKSFSYLPYAGYHYRISETSVSRRFNPKIVEIMEKTLSAYSDFVQRYEKGGEFVEAVRDKYHKVMMGEYLELYFLHKDNAAPEKEKVKEFYKLLEREPYKSTVGSLQPRGKGFYKDLMTGLLKKKKIRLLFFLKRCEILLKNRVVRQYAG